MEKTDIPETIQKGMKSLGYDSLLPIQKEIIPHILNKENLIIQAETGSGKTAAYLIPVLTMMNQLSSTTETLIIAPTRELAVQIHKEAAALGAYKGIHCISAIGGLDTDAQINALKHRPHLISATPGRLCDLIRSGSVDLSALQTLIIDEADQIYSTGQMEEMKFILNQMNTVQIILVSATLDENVTSFMKHEYQKLIFHSEKEVNQNIDEYYLLSENKEKTLYSLLEHEQIESAVIFVNHRSTVKELNGKLRKKNILSAPFSSDYDERTRLKTMKAFREGNIRILVATDAMARGIDLPGISHVIHFDLPVDQNTYIHRSGRSGHQQNEGITISLISKQEITSETALLIMKDSSEYAIDETQINDLSVPLQKETRGTDHTFVILIRAGRNDKIRPKDIVGALTSRIPFEEIGTIEIQDSYSLIRILNHDSSVVEELRDLKIKGKKRRIEAAKNQY